MVILNARIVGHLRTIFEIWKQFTKSLQKLELSW